MPFLFGLAIFVNAALLFAVQPLVAKMLLPALGGTPAVWNTCMVFFQAVLVAGYALAHILATRLSLKIQTAIFPAIQLLAYLTLPIALRDHWLASIPHESNPIPWLLAVLSMLVGLPFLIVATTGPILQRWFASTTHADAKDPYFLYAASNFGSMLALLSYPVLLEPTWILAEQARIWSGCFGILIFLTVACAVVARRHMAPTPTDELAPVDSDQPIVTVGRRLHWVALAFAPSSLLLGVTTYLTNDIGSVPLLWVVPLSLYLLSFIIAFARRPRNPVRMVSRIVPATVIILTIFLLSDAMQPPIGVLMVLHLVSFFILALFCHGELATDRPPATRITEFYLWIALGGALGGMFNALAAPVLFSRVLEYPLAVVMVCFLRRPVSHNEVARSARRLDWLLPFGVFLVTITLILLTRGVKWEQNQIKIGVAFALPALLCYPFVERPLRFALGILAIFLATWFVDADPRGTPLETRRSFFGVLRITGQHKQGQWFYALVHGNTIHGRQHQNPDGRPVPLSYYHESGPIGSVFRNLQPQLEHANIGVIGLGVGAMAWYADPGQEWDFFEIDPAVKAIAENTNYFRFLETCRVQPRIILGDARLRLREVPDGHYDLLVLDAFSSDAVPIHLLTREAFRLYFSKLKPNGVLVVHISNRNLDLKPVMAAAATDANLIARYSDDFHIDPAHVGKDPSQWVVMVRAEEDLGGLKRSMRWFQINDVPVVRVWTDEFSNILSIIRWQPGQED